MIIQRLTEQDHLWLQLAVRSRLPAAMGYGFDALLWLQNPRNIALKIGEDIALFQADEPAHFYEMHWIFQTRGAEALAHAKAMRDFMFDGFNALMLWGWTPVFCKGARWFNRKLGGQSRGVIETNLGPQEFFYLERGRWVSSRARTTQAEPRLP